MTTKERFAIVGVNRMNPLWLAIRAHLETRLDALRVQNDAIAKTEVETAAIRGRIAQIKELLDLDKIRPDTTPPS
jgi:hypothetical protein